jgi:hypothetical protein
MLTCLGPENGVPCFGGDGGGGGGSSGVTVFTRVICAPAYFAHPNF